VTRPPARPVDPSPPDGVAAASLAELLWAIAPRGADLKAPTPPCPRCGQVTTEATMAPGATRWACRGRVCPGGTIWLARRLVAESPVATDRLLDPGPPA
jgi:ribosomal protein S27AE